MFNFESFLSKYNFLFDSCKYTYYRNKCTKIVKDIFFQNVVSEDDKNLLFKYTSLHFDEWKKIIDEYNQKAIFDASCCDEYMDANNMPSAP